MAGDLQKEKDSIFQIILMERMGGALEQELSGNKYFQKINKEIERHFDKLDKSKLSKKQRTAVDRIFSGSNENSAEYGRVAYRQGFRDCLILMQELDQILKKH